MPSPANLLAAEHASLLSVPVETHSHWFLRLAWVDYWGATDLNFSGVVESEVGPITETEIGPDSISTPMLKANSIVAEKIAADAITGREISSATTITAGAGDKMAGMNGFDKSGEPLEGIRFWAGADKDTPENANFIVDSSGDLTARDAYLEDTTMQSLTATGAEINGDITGVANLTSVTISAGRIKGVIVDAATIIGSTIYASEPLLLADPYDDGRIVYYPDNPEIPVGCSEKVQLSLSSTGAHTEGVTFPVVTAAYDDSVSTTRFRWIDIKVVSSDRDSGYSPSQLKWNVPNQYTLFDVDIIFSLIHPVTGAVMDTVTHQWRQYEQRIYSFAGLNIRATSAKSGYKTLRYMYAYGGSFGSVSNDDRNGLLRVAIISYNHAKYWPINGIIAVDNSVRW